MPPLQRTITRFLSVAGMVGSLNQGGISPRELFVWDRLFNNTAFTAWLIGL
jgi:hypothetical protein